MSTYSIKDLENLSGIKAHTLRIWEQRYDLMRPQRTDTNIRLYDSKDLKLVLNIARLKDYGFKISRIASMSKDEMNQQILELTKTDPRDFQNHIHQLTQAMIDLDEFLFEQTLSTCILQWGLEDTMHHVIRSFLVKIGYLWQTEAIHPAQEHFISCLIRQKLIVAIDGQRILSLPKTRRFMLFLPEGELHEITLLFAHYLLKKAGNQVVYLGQSLPLSDVKLAAGIHQPGFLLTVITSSLRKKDLQQYLDSLAQTLPQTRVLISGWAVSGQGLRFPENFTHLSSLEELRSYC